MAKSKSSNLWLQEHHSDEFVKQAQREGYRGRAVYKLQELDQRYHLFGSRVSVVDLGAAPGSWSEYAARKIGSGGCILATDILPMDAIADVEYIQGDFREDDVLEVILKTLGSRPVDLVMSDMAPNMSGVGAVDIPRAMYLAELAQDLASQILSPGGNFLVKLFQGEGFDEYVRNLRDSYKTVIIRKPKASRPRSREMYALAQGYKL